ncbi:MAG: hypothetical protein JWR15_1189 [Prosthecobacter sp.]|nr:hypothetical protein [Prosthecobacter sp.]
MAISEKVMSHAPGHVSTEPLMATLGNTFGAPALEKVSRPATSHARQGSFRSHFADDQESGLPTEFQVTTLQPAPAPQQPSSKPVATGHDWSAQIEQLRNDIFGIAMNVSALNDRLDRMEQRIPQAGQSALAGIATLRGEIENWLETHLNGAVAHCMNQIISRPTSPASTPVN